FNDWIIEKIVMHGRYEDIIKMQKRYKLNNATYESADSSLAFTTKFVNFLNEYDDVVDEYKTFDAEGTGTFWTRYRRYFYNSLAMTSVLDIKATDIKQIADGLLSFLKKE